jgi:xylan 1,4-beta-xylosidase
MNALFGVSFIVGLITLNLHAQQEATNISQAEIQAILNSGSGISGPGKSNLIAGRGWRTGYEGVMYSGPNPKAGWLPLNEDRASGAAVTNGFIPPIKPLLDVHLRDVQITVGGDGNYYMTGSTGDNVFSFNDGVELWRSSDLVKWNYLGLVWSIERDGTWEKRWVRMRNKPSRAVWAPEIHFVKNNYFIVLSMIPGGISILKSTTGKPEGPYINASKIDCPILINTDPTLFQDDDGTVYFTCLNANRVARMKDDMSGFAEAPRKVNLAEPDTNPAHHAEKCRSRGMGDIGVEGATMFKANGKYYLAAADIYEGRKTIMISISDNPYGPYHSRHECISSSGGSSFFQDKQGRWWAAYFGNDNQSPFREKPGIIHVEFDSTNNVIVSKDQPFVDDFSWGQ